MKTIAVFFTVLLLSGNGFPQGITKDENEKVLRSVTNNIIRNTTYDFVDAETNEVIKAIDEKNYKPSIRIRSPYNTWNYWNGVLNIAMLDMAAFFGDDRYEKWAIENYAFAFDNYAVFEKLFDPEKDNKWTFPFGQYIVTRELDDCGAMGGGLIEVYEKVKRKEYKDYIDKAAEHITNGQERLVDGTMVRHFPHKMTIWADDLYMGIVFLARLGHFTGEVKYFDDAANQVILYNKYLYNPTTQLYYHGWYSDIKENGVAHWGRCNGWVMLAQANLLEFLPEDHPKRDTLLSILHQQVLGVSRYQSESGLWHQLIDKTDSYLETSCTAMFTYSIAKGVNNGWLDARYASVAKQGWEGIKGKVQDDGQVRDICVGTGMEDNLVFYYKRPTKLNDTHGLGAVILAGVEILKMEE